MKRRRFLKMSAMAAATGAVCDAMAAGNDNKGAGGVDPALRKGALKDVTWNKAPCRFCGTGCHVQVGVRKNKVVAIAGDRLAPVNKGLLCVKGYHVGLALYGADRLTRPLLKKGDKHVPISWEKAIKIIAERIKKSPKSFAMYGSGQWTIPEGYAAQKFMKGGLGNNHIDPNARLCMASAVTGFISTYGVDEPASCFDDLDRADVVILWGNNPAEMHPVLFSRLIDRRSKGQQVKLIDIGTRHTRSTAFADEYLEMKPQGDLAILNGLLRLLIGGPGYRADFVKRYCGFRHAPGGPHLIGRATDEDSLRKHLSEFTPERVQQLSGIAPAKLRMLADLFANKKLRITSLWCMGANQHTRGTAVNRLIHAVHLLSGHWGREGDGPQSLTGQPSACGTAREVGTLAHALPGGRVVKNPEHRAQSEAIWNLPNGRVQGKPGLHTLRMWEEFCKAGGEIDTIWVQVTNPGHTLPDVEKLFLPSRKLKEKFLIVSDAYPTATTRQADLILPSAMWVEKNGMVGNSERRTQQWFKQVDPPGEARDDAWQIIAVARKLYELGFEGMKDKSGKFLFAMTSKGGKPVPVWKWKHYYDINVDEQLFEEYRKFSRLKHKDLAPYGEYVKARGLRWPVVKKNGRWQETRYRFVEGHDPYVKQGSGIQFYHSTSKDNRAQIWLEPYVAPPETPNKEYPFWLCTGRVLEHWHSGTMTMRIAPLREAMPRAYVEMHPADARKLGANSGDMVRVQTRRGKLNLRVWVNGRGMPAQGSLFIPFFDESLLANVLTLDAHCPISKQPDYKKCAARVELLSREG